MSELLGIDIAGARGLVTLLQGWATDTESIITTVAQAETLADLPTFTQGPLATIGTDSTVMASTVSDAADALESFSIETVATAHANGLDYDVAKGLNMLVEIDELSASMHSAPPPVVSALSERRGELLAELAGTDDPEILRALTTLLGSGLPAAEAFAGLDQQLAVQRENERIMAVAAALDLDFAAASDLLTQMQGDTNALAERGWPIEDAAIAVQAATMADLDLGVIESVAEAERVSLVDAANQVASATAAGMSLAEFEAYEGLIAHFAELDAAQTGTTDDLITLGDLEYVVDNPDEFNTEVVAAAAALIATPSVRHRIDTATENNNVIGPDPFGNTRPDDHKYSLGDLEQFQFKQAVNFLVSGHLDQIDVAQQNGDPSLIDGTQSKQDFQTYLDQHRADLSEQEILALETVIEAEWYDKGFWEEHKGTITLAAGVLAGGAIFVLTGGVGAPLTAALISGAYAVGGAVVVGGATTLGGNAIFGDDLTDDLGQGMINGGVGGLGGVGLVALPAALSTGSLGVKTLAALGGVADVSGLTAAGLFDPALGLVLDDIDLVNFKDHAETTAWVTGGVAAAGTVVTIGGRRFLVNLADAPAPRPVDAANIPEGAPLVGALDAEIPEQKLVGYALDPNHPVGGDKAIVFESALGFNQSNADELMDAIRNGVVDAPSSPHLTDQHGVRYTVDLPVTGPNGNTAIVRTGWIYRPGSSVPSLTTLVVK